MTVMQSKPFAITLDAGTSRANKTGAWRTERPVYRDLMPPCNNACPAGENIQQWLYHAEEGDPAGYEAAWRQIMADNPVPAVMGRVCYRPCETACNRAQLDSAVGINSVSVSSATRRSGRAGRCPSTRRRRASGCWW
jgi:NADPH-dependent glutamate synthase beta subunit-like oxidoreductase